MTGTWALTVPCSATFHFFKREAVKLQLRDQQARINSPQEACGAYMLVPPYVVPWKSQLSA